MQPAQSINYVECHDNHTFGINGLMFEEDADTKRLRQRLAVSIVLLSQGVPFLHAGQEFAEQRMGTATATGPEMTSISLIGKACGALRGCRICAPADPAAKKPSRFRLQKRKKSRSIFLLWTVQER
ncbi:hypothetical protein PO124_09995 [Bacillus licheniformis]|nr:hypothetical protein [Bacillus licheniformis]